MYIPRPFAVEDETRIAEFVDAAGVADLVTFDGAKLVASLIPVIWERDHPDPGTFGRLVGHLALANPQWQGLREDSVALAIVRGPQAYVSPSWYASKARHGKVVPTWNYATVHLSGPIRVRRDPEWLREVVSRLTDRHERPRANPWAVTDAPPDFVDGQLRAIVGVEMTVAMVEAKHKLSQNRDAADQAGVVAGLRGEPGAGPAAVADLMARQASGADATA